MDEYELIGLFCTVADFVDEFNKMPQKELEYQKKRIRNRQFRTTLSERMTILIMFHKSKGIAFCDSTALTSCHVKRASSHKTFKNEAKWGKTSTGWFFGFIHKKTQKLAFDFAGILIF